MLCLTRKNGQRIFLTMADGRTISIKVDVDYRKSKILVGIEAPPDVKIAREELVQKEEAK